MKGGIVSQTLKIFLLIPIILFPVRSWAAGNGTTLSPDQALESLLAGNKRFVAGNVLHPQQVAERRDALVEGQNPFAIVLSCSDSRVPPEIVFDQGLGELFVVRVAGNTFTDLELGSIEYGASVLKAPLIMVLGHDRCGAVEATLAGKPLPGHMGALTKQINSDIEGRTCATHDKLRCAIDANVLALVKQLQNSEPILASLTKEGKLKVVGARYVLKTGEVKLLH
jgi:carbonic anhydrase